MWHSFLNQSPGTAQSLGEGPLEGPAARFRGGPSPQLRHLSEMRKHFPPPGMLLSGDFSHQESFLGQQELQGRRMRGVNHQWVGAAGVDPIPEPGV